MSNLYRILYLNKYFCTGMVITKNVEAFCPNVKCNNDAECIEKYNPPPGADCHCVGRVPGHRMCVCPCPVMPPPSGGATNQIGLDPSRSWCEPYSFAALSRRQITKLHWINVKTRIRIKVLLVPTNHLLHINFRVYFGALNGEFWHKVTPWSIRRAFTVA